MDHRIVWVEDGLIGFLCMGTKSETQIVDGEEHEEVVCQECGTKLRVKYCVSLREVKSPVKLGRPLEHI